MLPLYSLPPFPSSLPPFMRHSLHTHRDGHRMKRLHSTSVTVEDSVSYRLTDAFICSPIGHHNGHFLKQQPTAHLSRTPRGGSRRKGQSISFAGSLVHDEQGQLLLFPANKTLLAPSGNGLKCAHLIHSHRVWPGRGRQPPVVWSGRQTSCSFEEVDVQQDRTVALLSDKTEPAQCTPCSSPRKSKYPVMITHRTLAGQEVPKEHLDHSPGASKRRWSPPKNLRGHNCNRRKEVPWNCRRVGSLFFPGSVHHYKLFIVPSQSGLVQTVRQQLVLYCTQFVHCVLQLQGGEISSIQARSVVPARDYILLLFCSMIIGRRAPPPQALLWTAEKEKKKQLLHTKAANIPLTPLFRLC
ncbi:uncharacterized protein YALI1_C17440g [Yarrowia lipolytica]|uniref:Uncharacterized protein n=1 Tax=Yarrowia lipolytica TaxID=4952 RepID=A0A1D8NAU9_YARLL|nr:hypothetical protein YALI1_C17440g [Yarrowia lipolytica]